MYYSKKLIVICLFLLCGNELFSQIYSPVTPTIYGMYGNRIKERYAIGFPEKDTVKLTNDDAPQIFYRPIDSTFWGWSLDRGYFQLGIGGGGGIAVDDSIFVGGYIDTITFAAHPGKKGITVPFSIMDSLKHQFIDTGSAMRDAYCLVFDSTNRKWILGPCGSGGGGITLQHNNITNGSQTILNLKDGAGTFINDDGVGGITIDAQNFSNSDLQLTGDRSQDYNGHSFTFFDHSTGLEFIANNTGGGVEGFEFFTPGFRVMRYDDQLDSGLFVDGKVQFSSYNNASAFTGGATHGLGVDASGILKIIPLSGAGTVTSIATTAPITGGTITTTGTIGITQATTSTNGYLSSTDWNTFNGKQTAGNFFTRSGDTASYLGLRDQTVATPIPVSGVNEFDSSGRLSWRNSLGKTASISMNKIASLGAVIDSLPSYSGTFVMKYNADSIFNKVIDFNKNTALNFPAGTVTSVSGTTNRITSTGGATPVLDISATFEALLGKVASPLSQFASTTSAQLSGVLSDETGSGLSVFATTPVFTTNITAPLVIGGTGTTSTLTLQTTSGSGTTASDIIFKDDNTEWARILNNGNLGVGATSPLGRIQTTQDIAAIAGTGAYGQLEITGATNTAKRLSIGYNTTANYGFITALTNAATFDPLILGSGTNSTAVSTVGIGTVAPNSRLHVAGSLATAYRAITALRTLDITDNTIECTSGTFTVTLPTSVGITGREYWITNTGSGVITIGTTSSQTFINVVATPTTLTVAQFTNYKVVANGANWLAYKIVN